MTSSMMPYSLASSADITKSRSVSWWIFSIGWPGVVGQDLLEQVPHAQDLLGRQLDVGGLALGLGVGLVEQDPGVRAGPGACPACRPPAARRRPRRPARSRWWRCRA